MAVKDPMNWNGIRALMCLAVADDTGASPTSTPDGRTLRGLQARGLAHTMGLTTAGREVALEILGLARLDPELLEKRMREVRQICGEDDELLKSAEGP